MQHDDRSFLGLFVPPESKRIKSLFIKTSWLLENYKRKKKSEVEVLYQNEIVKKAYSSLITDLRNEIEATTKL